MKTIELKTVPLNIHGVESQFSYGEFIGLLMETPEKPESGAGIGEIRNSIRVLDALKSADKELVLEDADFSYLLQRVKSARFTASNKVFIDFIDYFENIE